MRIKRANHQCLGVAAKRVLQQVGELALSKIDEAGLLLASFGLRVFRELIDDFSKVR